MNRSRFWGINAGLVMFLVGIPAMARHAYREGNTIHAASGMLAFTALLLFAIALWTRNAAGAPVITHDPTGTTVRASTAQRALAAVALIFAALAAVLIGYLQLRGQIHWDPHAHGRGRSAPVIMPILLPLIGLAAAVGLPFLVRALFDLRSPTFIELTPAGIRMAYNPRKQRTVAWEDIADIPAVDPWARSQGRMLTIVPRQGRRIATPQIGIGENLCRVSDLLRFYWNHPDRRHELTDGTATARASQRTIDGAVRTGAGR